jgi:hypothetical protein
MGDGGSVAGGGGASREARTVSNPLSGIGEAIATTGATVTFFGGQSMFLLKLGACETGSSF